MKSISDLTDKEVINELVDLSEKSPWMFTEKGPTTLDSISYERFQGLRDKACNGGDEKYKVAFDTLESRIRAESQYSNVTQIQDGERYVLNQVSQNLSLMSGATENISEREFYQSIPSNKWINKSFFNQSKEIKNDMSKRIDLDDNSVALYFSYYSLSTRGSSLNEMAFIKSLNKYAAVKTNHSRGNDVLHLHQIEDFEQQGQVLVKGLSPADFSIKTKGNTMSLKYNPYRTRKDPQMIPSILEDYFFNGNKIEFEETAFEDKRIDAEQLSLNFE